jgi:2-polyprenyl-3-methyl-5-hydroxy-6-metoxy-1,4-benzoquinol methylase
MGRASTAGGTAPTEGHVPTHRHTMLRHDDAQSRTGNERTMTAPESLSSVSTERVPACEVCSSTAARVLYDGVVDTLWGVPLAWRFVVCEECETVRLDPRPDGSGLSHAYPPSYSARKSAIPSPKRQGLRRRISSAVRRSILASALGYGRAGFTGSGLVGFLGTLLPFLRNPAVDSVMGIRYLEGGRLLDVGCGVGQFLGTLVSLGWNATGIDTDERVLESCRQRGLDARVGTLEQQRFPDEYFDIVTMRHVIEHIPRPGLVLAEIARILKPGGRLVITTPNAASLSHTKLGRFWMGLDAPRHVNIFTPPSLVNLLGKAQLKSHSICTTARMTFFLGKLSHANARYRINAYTSRPPFASVLYARWLVVRTRVGLWRDKQIGDEIVAVATK